MTPLQLPTVRLMLHDLAGPWAAEPGHLRLWLGVGRRVGMAAFLAPPRRRETVQRVSVGGKVVGVVGLGGVLAKGQPWDGTSTVQLRNDVRRLSADPSVSAILLHIDSPGGTTAGTPDLAADLTAARQRKPVWSFVEDLGAGTAYWLAASTGKVYANNTTALVGGVGTVHVVYDLSGAAERAGVKALVFGTGPLKSAGLPGSVVTEEQQDYFRGLVESAQQSFDAAVSRGRGLHGPRLAAVKSGGAFGAREAQAKGLIDGVKSLDEVLADLARVPAKG